MECDVRIEGSEESMVTWTRLRTACCLAMAIISGACRINPKYCEGNAGPNNCDLMWDAAMTGCTSNDTCSGSTPVCDLTGSKICVQCIAPDQTNACTGTTPVCGTDHLCQACTMHAQCVSNACLPDGSCGDDTSVAYVDPAGTDKDQCTQAKPCLTVAKALAMNRPFVKFHGTTEEAVMISGRRNVTFLGDSGAKLTFGGVGAIVTVRDDETKLSVYDLSISDAQNVKTIGILIPPAAGAATVALFRANVSNDPGGGISVSSGMLTVQQSTVTGNSGGGVLAFGGTLTVQQSTIADNTGGGVSITSAEFDLENNMIVKNGSPGSSFGGVLISQANAGMRRFAFNTVAQNQATMGITPGVLCAAVANEITFTNSIVFGNGTGTQVEGMKCSWTYSDIGPQTVVDTGNINADPMFVNVSPTQNDFHISASSPCKDAADPAATLDSDIDGDIRPQGSGRDIGADEIKR
jgi:hypothetical protein